MTTTHEAAPDQEPQDWTAVAACTLPTAERPLRLAEFDDLFADALVSVEQTGPTTARLRLSGDRTLAGRTRRLADAESTCCSFFTFGVTEPEPGEVAFDIEVPAPYADVLDGLVDRARARLAPAENAS